MAENYILFTIAGTNYALRTRDVAHIEMVEQITGVLYVAVLIARLTGIYRPDPPPS